MKPRTQPIQTVEFFPEFLGDELVIQIEDLLEEAVVGAMRRM
jgi:hypothetical protein